MVDEVEPRIRELADMAVGAWTAAAERIGWELSIRILRDWGQRLADGPSPVRPCFTRDVSAGLVGAVTSGLRR